MFNVVLVDVQLRVVAGSDSCIRSCGDEPRPKRSVEGIHTPGAVVVAEEQLTTGLCTMHHNELKLTMAP